MFVLLVSVLWFVGFVWLVWVPVRDVDVDGGSITLNI